ncbi:fused response regulator/phosphatase [Nitrospira defluvii]|nr:fused response regulator/phosphatase [Nitrospira defluvii]
MKILIADDTDINLKVISTFCKNQGYDIVTARDGRAAVEKFSPNPIDLVLMDVMMPVMDGYEATSKIKAISGDMWIPVILVTALEDNEENLTKGISCGADDYLTKPVNLFLLREKIKVMERISTMQQTLHDRCVELEGYKENNKEEQLLARQIMERIVRETGTNEELMQQWILPAEIFSADIVAASITPDNRMHVILADGTGHGLAAALCVMPVTETFYAMTPRGFSLSAIVEELTQKLKRLTPTERFVSATLVAIDWVEQTIEVWNGGGMPAVFIDEDGTVRKEWKSTHLPIGIQDRHEIDSRTVTFRWDEPGQLFLFSDGLVEARDKNRRMFGLERLLDILSKTPSPDRFKKLKEVAENHFDQGSNEDDVSLIEIRCPIHHEKSIHKTNSAGQSSSCIASRWRIDLLLESRDIKREACLPMLFTWIKQSGVPEWHSQRLFSILSDLYQNAVARCLELGFQLKIAFSWIRSLFKKTSRAFVRSEEWKNRDPYWTGSGKE